MTHIGGYRACLDSSSARRPINGRRGVHDAGGQGTRADQGGSAARHDLLPRQQALHSLPDRGVTLASDNPKSTSERKQTQPCSITCTFSYFELTNRSSVTGYLLYFLNKILSYYIILCHIIFFEFTNRSSSVIDRLFLPTLVCYRPGFPTNVDLLNKPRSRFWARSARSCSRC